MKKVGVKPHEQDTAKMLETEPDERCETYFKDVEDLAANYRT